MPLTLYQEFKLIVVEFTGLSKDALHIYVGLLTFFAAVAVLKKGNVDSSALIPEIKGTEGLIINPSVPFILWHKIPVR